MRFGIQLPFAMYTNADGSIPGLTVNGETAPYQVDPANGRIYFQSVDQDRNISVSYTALDEGTGAAVNIGATNYTIGYVTERSESPVPIDQAVNESESWFSLDPFDLAGNAGRRPGLWWTFWTSTRTGTSDIFVQTVAPRFTPNARR
jgi:hypothetical protein